MPKKILVVEDDKDIGDLIENILVTNGYSVCRAYSGTEALLVVRQNKFDLIMLDLMLPGLNGEDVIKDLKVTVPIIVVSAKASIDDKVSNLLNGASDYITKPFNSNELLARVQVQLRNATQPTNELCYESVYIDSELNVAYADEKPLKLTKTEFAILNVLIKNPKKIYTKSQLADLISENGDIWESSLNVHIHNLRKKIFEACGKNYIEAIWGMGYRFQVNKS